MVLNTSQGGRREGWSLGPSPFQSWALQNPARFWQNYSSCTKAVAHVTFSNGFPMQWFCCAKWEKICCTDVLVWTSNNKSIHVEKSPVVFWLSCQLLKRNCWPVYQKESLAESNMLNMWIVNEAFCVYSRYYYCGVYARPDSTYRDIILFSQRVNRYHLKKTRSSIGADRDSGSTRPLVYPSPPLCVTLPLASHLLSPTSVGPTKMFPSHGCYP